MRAERESSPIASQAALVGTPEAAPFTQNVTDSDLLFLPPNLEAELLRHALLNQRPLLVVNFLAACGFTYLAWTELGIAVGAWLVLMALISSLRWTAGMTLYRSQLRRERRWGWSDAIALRVFYAGYVASPFAWAAMVVWAIPLLEPFTLLALIVVLAALVGGATGVLAPLRYLGQVNMFLLLVPGSFRLLSLDPPQWILALLGVVFAGVAMISHRFNNDLLRRALTLQHRNDFLLQRVSESNAAILEANAELESRVEARTIELRELSQRDLLTGLLNRRGLVDLLRHFDERQTPLAVLFIDLNGFKQVNDGLGHEAGDEVLRIAARQLATAVPMDASIGRWGGDEFVLIWPARVATEALISLGHHLRTALAVPILVGDERVQLGATIGYAIRGANETGAELVTAADLATAEARRNDQGGIAGFEPGLAVVQQRRLQIVGGLRTAVDDQSLWLAYQPIVFAGSDKLHSLEALMRWTSPRLGVVGPDEFIAIAEDSDRIQQLGDWALRRALADCLAAGAEGPPQICVNVSIRQLAWDGFYASVVAALSELGFAPERLVLEVTESVFEDRNSHRTLSALRALANLGVRIHVDDFGSGYSSLGSLHNFPLHAIKIDRIFVERLDTQSRSVIEAAVLIARGHGLEVIAEGIETAEQARVLHDLGVDALQGYYFGRPQPALLSPRR